MTTRSSRLRRSLGRSSRVRSSRLDRLSRCELRSSLSFASLSLRSSRDERSSLVSRSLARSSRLLLDFSSRLDLSSRPAFSSRLAILSSRLDFSSRGRSSRLDFSSRVERRSRELSRRVRFDALLPLAVAGVASSRSARLRLLELISSLADSAGAPVASSRRVRLLEELVSSAAASRSRSRLRSRDEAREPSLDDGVVVVLLFALSWRRRESPAGLLGDCGGAGDAAATTSASV